MTTYVISLLKAIDIRSDSAIKVWRVSITRNTTSHGLQLLSEFLDTEAVFTETGKRYPNAEHFAHGKRDLTFHSFDKYDWHVSQRNSDKRTYGLQSYIAIFDHHTKALQPTTRTFRYFLVYV